MKIIVLVSFGIFLILTSLIISNLDIPQISLPAISINNVNNINSKDEYLVTKVIDGDTFELENGQKVRMIGIDTPEVYNFGEPKECFADEASDYTKNLLEGKKVHLEKDISDEDRFDRLLRYVYLDDTFINEELVKNGYAFARSYPPDTLYEELFTEAEKSARTDKIGLWDKCTE